LQAKVIAKLAGHRRIGQPTDGTAEELPLRKPPRVEGAIPPPRLDLAGFELTDCRQHRILGHRNPANLGTIGGQTRQNHQHDRR